LSPYWFGLAVKRGCEAVVHGIQTTSDAHFDWVLLHVNIANTFNTISHKAIFQELREMKGQLSQLFPFVHFFYGFKVPLFFNYHYSSRALSIIFSFMGICQGDPFVRVFFMLVHFHTLCCASWVSSLCLFPSLVDDTHIFDPTHVISLVSDHFVSHLASMGLIVQLCKCLA
jgi:hypothetical protein